MSVSGKVVLDSTVLPLMKIWEETSYQLERRQTNVECAAEEYNGLQDRTVPAYSLTFNPDDTTIARDSKSLTRTWSFYCSTVHDEENTVIHCDTYLFLLNSASESRCNPRGRNKR